MATPRGSAAPGCACRSRGWDQNTGRCVSSFSAGSRRCRGVAVTVSNVRMHVRQYHVGIPVCRNVFRGSRVLSRCCSAALQYTGRHIFQFFQRMSSACCARPCITSAYFAPNRRRGRSSFRDDRRRSPSSLSAAASIFFFHALKIVRRMAA